MIPVFYNALHLAAKKCSLPKKLEHRSIFRYTYVITNKGEDNMGIIILISLILFELVFLVWNISEKDLHQKEKLRQQLRSI